MVNRLITFLKYHYSERIEMPFWYSKKTASMGLLFLFTIVLSISSLTPPFQSPDEFNHIKRAYLLSKGKILLDTKNGLTGGEIDQGLLSYMDRFQDIPFHRDNKVALSDMELSEKITWTSQRTFSGFPNTAAYFPLPYMPQAASLWIGENAGLSVANSYRMARLFSLMSSILILGLALFAFPAPPIVLALVLTPMCLFQLASASLDAITTSIFVLCISLFMRGALTSCKFTKGMMNTLSLCIFALATSRLNLLPLTMLPAILYLIKRDRSYLIHCGVLVIASSSWILFALLTVQGMGRDSSVTNAADLSTAKIISYYIQSPSQFFKVLDTTVTNPNMILSYWKMYIGVLGWLDTPFNIHFYDYFAVLFVVFALMSVHWKMALLREPQRIALAVICIFSIILLFFILLVSWSAHPAKVIDGVQGRYFTSCFIMLAYALSDFRPSAFRLRILIGFLCLSFFSSAYSIPRILLERYYMQEKNTRVLTIFNEDWGNRIENLR